MASAVWTLLVVGLPGTASWAESPPPCVGADLGGACGAAGDDDLNVTLTDPGAEPAAAAGGTSGGNRPVVARPVHAIETTLEPACSANGPDSAGVPCIASTNFCPLPEDTAFWVWTRDLNTQTGVTGPWVRQTDPPFRCLGPTDPAVVQAVPVEVLIAGILSRGFASLPLPKGEVAVRPPGGQTLINIDTRLFTVTGSQPLPPRIILGKTVTVTASAQRYDWHMGDGTDYADVGPGSEAAPIRHVYRQPGQVGPYVTVTWGGTFNIQGDPRTFPIIGTASTDGPPAALAVRAARSELVAK
jgi:hypothetical protein